MQLPRVIVITDWSLGRRALLQKLAPVVALGPQVGIQHRHPHSTARAFLDEGRALSELCGASGASVFINGRLDVALLLGAHLHLPTQGPEVSEVRRHLPPFRWISAAVHDRPELDRRQDADLVLISPVFGAGSKPGDARAPLGADGFVRLSQFARPPAYALGAMDPDRTRQLKPRGVAAISWVLNHDDPSTAVRQLLDAL